MNTNNTKILRTNQKYKKSTKRWRSGVADDHKHIKLEKEVQKRAQENNNVQLRENESSLTPPPPPSPSPSSYDILNSDALRTARLSAAAVGEETINRKVEFGAHMRKSKSRSSSRFFWNADIDLPGIVSLTSIAIVVVVVE
ncbi:hypothetical protein CVT25_008413 [Psilocybe cyanescens]|uniref:Uncharacterized protein n=1 Tax=Psilocybe cyanescens TaxID=93625 RepID=A0A409VQG7_PSICY|nr:hypothetical protein CVT25_008413 [Psilocybe cyanescens]